MISLKEFSITKISDANNASEFVISPLPAGYGQTLGNNLRRVLLSSIPGTAITAVKINNANHEYTTLTGLSDDVLQIILSLKNVVLNSKIDEPVVLTLKAKGKAGEVVNVTAGDIEKNADVEVINPDYVITKLSDEKANIEMSITVKRGIGYSLPNEEVREEVSVLPVDAIFSPIKSVKFAVEPTRVGEEVELDKLVLTIKTDGSLTPSDAISISSNILLEMSQNFVEQTKDMISGKVVTTLPTKELVNNKKEDVQSDKEPILINDLNLSTRLTNALVRAGFDDLRKLDGFTEEEVANIRGMGEKSLVELLDILKKYEVKLI